VSNLNNPRNPTQGIQVDMLAESGSKSETRVQILAGEDTTTVISQFRQERLQMYVRAFLPISQKHTVLVGSDFRLLLSPGYVESDLFRMGGAKTLRGYDEDRFVTDSAVRILTEYRILVGPSSYAFAFLDIAYIHRPELNGIESSADWYPGYGIGMQWETAAGLFNASYAINNEDGPTRGRIHMGLAFGL
jgi:outer membrane protein assembly factor BamA